MTDPEPYPPGTTVRYKDGGEVRIVSEEDYCCKWAPQERNFSSGRACDKPKGHEGRHRYRLIFNIFDTDPRLRRAYYYFLRDGRVL